MVLNKGLFSSIRTDWRTPKQLYNLLNKEFKFNFDPCPVNPQFDGLKISWKKRNFVNPPYGNQISNWIKKGFEEWQKGKLIVFLIPSRTDTKYWHDYLMKATEIRFIRGRIKFEHPRTKKITPAPFPSAIVIFKPKEVE